MLVLVRRVVARLIIQRWRKTSRPSRLIKVARLGKRRGSEELAPRGPLYPAPRESWAGSIVFHVAPAKGSQHLYPTQAPSERLVVRGYVAGVWGSGRQYSCVEAAKATSGPRSLAQ